MKNKFKYRDSEYFNDLDIFVFQDHMCGTFDSKVYKERGTWWTEEKLEFKATTIKCHKK